MLFYPHTLQISQAQLSRGRVNQDVGRVQVAVNHALLMATIHEVDYPLRVHPFNQVQRLAVKPARDQDVFLQPGE